MKIVIDIPEETYKGVLELWETEKDSRFKCVVDEAIVNGKVIPNEHGKRPQGYWKKNKWGNISCSNCGRDTRNPHYPFFCCFCGADMGGSRE